MQTKYFLRYTFALNLPHLTEVGKSRNQNLYKLYDSMCCLCVMSEGLWKEIL